MILPQHAAYRRLFLLGLLVQVVAAWFSVGFNHYDEHFQVLEFCNYKLGLSPASALPWEFGTQCRGGVQPFIAYCCSKTLMFMGAYNPFVVAFLLRLMMGVLTWLVTCRLVKILLPEFVTDRGKHLFVWASFLMWFVGYDGVRFSAENFAGVLFFLALSFVLEIRMDKTVNRNVRLMITGLLLGLVFMLRLQMAFAYLGMGLWILLFTDWGYRNWATVIFFGLVGVGLCMVADHWFYGNWVFTPYNYYKVNILQHAAAKFGVYPWWYYFSLFIQYVIPPLSVVLLPLFFVGVWKNYCHLFTWVSVPFIIGHCLIGHKEMRFLLPMVFPLLFLSFSAVDWLIVKYKGKWFLGWPVKLFFALNSVALFVKILIPSNETIPYYQFIYNYCQKQPAILMSYESSPYYIAELTANFYKPDHLNEVIVHTPEELATVIGNAHGKTVLFMNPEIQPIPLIAGYKKEKMYCILPEWAKLLNIGDWQSRSRIWTIYKLQ